MNHILLKQSINRWTKASSFLKLHRADLTAEEIGAVNVLLSAWKSGALTPEIVRQCSAAIDTINASHKYHSNNRDVITNLKDLCAVASQLYCSDGDTYRQFRIELSKLAVTQSEPQRWPVVSQPQAGLVSNPVARSSQTAISTAQSVNRILIKQDVVKWREAMVYMLANRHALSDDEINAIEVIMRAVDCNWNRNVALGCDRASEVLRNSSNLHINDRKIIEHEKTICGLVQRHIAGAGANSSNEFIVALNEYLRTNPINVPPQSPSMRTFNRNDSVNRNTSHRQSGMQSVGNWWSRLNDRVRHIGLWFEDLAGTLPDVLSSIGYFLMWGVAIIAVISILIEDGLIAALLAGILSLIIVRIVAALFMLIADKAIWLVLMALRFVFYNIYTLLVVVALLMANVFLPYFNYLVE